MSICLFVVYIELLLKNVFFYSNDWCKISANVKLFIIPMLLNIVIELFKRQVQDICKCQDIHNYNNYVVQEQPYDHHIIKILTFVEILHLSFKYNNYVIQ